MKNSWLVIACLRLLFVRKLDYCIVTLREIPLVLVLKNLRLLKGGLTILKREQGFTVVRHGEAASWNKDAEKFVEKFKDFVDREGFIPEQVFNCDETGLFWGRGSQKGPTSQEKRRLVFMEYVSPSKQ
jgi:hypothetical protein